MPKKIGDLYNSFMDEAGIEKLGISPIAKDLAAAQSINSLADFLKTLGEFEARGLSGLFYSFRLNR
jgi:Predicted metalloendopeptidase